MTTLLVFAGWYAAGVIGLWFGLRPVNEIRLGELGMWAIYSILGPAVWIILAICALQDRGIWDTVIWRKRS